MENKFNLIIRKNVKAKPRKWFIERLNDIRIALEEFLKGKKRSLAQNSSLTVVITNNKEIKKLNFKFRKKNLPTDVLSFHLNEDKQITQRYIGDIIISSQYARKNAVSNGVTIEYEILNLLVHGYLHLLGYDHIAPKEAKVMFKLQNRIINETWQKWKK